MLKLLHIAAKEKHRYIWTDLFTDALKKFGDLTVIEHGGKLAPEQVRKIIRDNDVLLTCWDAVPVPEDIAENPGRLGYICHITGEMRRYISQAIIDSDITVTNWGDAPAGSVAEGAVTLLLAMLKNLPRQVLEVREGGWHLGDEFPGGSLDDLTVGLYGFGVIGRRFAEMLSPFHANMLIYDPYIQDIPAYCKRVQSLENLFQSSHVIIVLAALSDQTRKSVTARLLAMLPDQGIIINVARGGIMDQAALFKELESGRLRAGLDVLEPDRLEPDHKARKFENCIFSAHDIAPLWTWHKPHLKALNRVQENCIGNIRRYSDNRPLLYVMDTDRYAKST
jgi:phosphoglycerate dehydrogenase-like enzyme